MPVPARYHAIRDRVVAAVDLRFAEPVELFFLANKKSDPDRPNCDIEAVVRVSGGKASMPGDARSGDRNVRFAAQSGTAHINRATYDGPEIRKGDKLRAMSRTGEPWFEVLRVDDRNHSRIVLEIGEA